MSTKSQAGRKLAGGGNVIGQTRLAIIHAVKNPLSFFVLVMLAVEATLGAVAARSTGQNQVTALYSMVFITLALIVAVAFLTYTNSPLTSRQSLTNEEGLKQILKFCEAISGSWWEKILQDDESAISTVEIVPDATTCAVKIKGQAFNRSGRLAAIWHSTAACVNPLERKVFYYWEGSYSSRPEETRAGWGEVSFFDDLQTADGGFSDANLRDWSKTLYKTFLLARATKAEAQVMRDKDGQQATSLILSKLK